MWSIHPALGCDGASAPLLEVFDPRLARLPLARTNRGLRGRTEGAEHGRRRDFHHCAPWVADPVHEELAPLVDPEWFAATGLFETAAIERLTLLVRRSPDSARRFGKRPFELGCWLASARRLHGALRDGGATVGPRQAADLGVKAPVASGRGTWHNLRVAAQRSDPLGDALRWMRDIGGRLLSAVRYPPPRAARGTLR